MGDGQFELNIFDPKPNCTIFEVQKLLPNTLSIVE
jgi:hypothetical protein